MSSSFLYLLNKCRTPTLITLREALKERTNLSINESNFITYIAGFSGYEFADKLFDEFGLEFVENTSILFDKINKKLCAKVLINDQSLRLKNFALPQLSQIYQLSIFTSSIAWRNIDGSYVSNIYDEVKNLNRFQYEEYISHHIIGLSEDVLSYEIKKNGISLVIHFVTVSQRNTAINLRNLFNRVCTGIFVNSPDDAPNLSIASLSKSKKEIAPLLKRIKWYVIDMNSSKQVTDFLAEIGAEKILIPYLGYDYNYFSNLLSDVEVFMKQHCKNL